MPQPPPSPTSATPPRAELEQLGAALHRSAAAARHRGIAVLAGDRKWSATAAQALLSTTPLREILWIGSDAPGDADFLPPGRALSLLGKEFDAVVYDARAGFDPDAFGAVAGTIRGGGLLLLTTPPLKTWPDFTDPEYRRITVAPCQPENVTGRFLRRAVRVFRDNAEPTLIEQQGQDYIVRRGQTDRPARTPLDTPPPPYRTLDQQQAVEAVIKVITGQRRRPVVLTSDRGRGKSAALGLAAANLMRGTARHILVTGPGVEAVDPLFRHAGQQLKNARGGRGTLHCGDATLRFHPPDQILRDHPQTDLLLVDEAAAIPIPLLEQLLERYSRIAFATTVHGYEGTGRGFELRFRHILDRKTRGWRALQMEAPIRWATDDPLERFTFRLLMLDAAVAPEAALRSIRPEACKIERIDRERLLEDENSLSELFGLLVFAHYRTRPYDLRHLLDGPNLSIYLMRYREHVVGAVLAA
ncbi:MAG: tRNA(Met) cytidine acetyltransferase TmcA domain-containing protein, partial [Pseudomonadota bacterium]|nr:tRNA(Met) cytidine acetyltransferase TmcA domain-containing protein [Pseudomonadota bacterium]